MMTVKKRAVFLDRDGVLTIPEFRNGRSYAPRKLADFVLYSEAKNALLKLKDSGFRLIIVSNQPDVGAGFMSLETLHKMNDVLLSELPIDLIKICIHTRENQCECRKPKPGMLIEAAREIGIDLGKSFMIGDRASDITAGKSAGCSTIFIDLNYTSEEKPEDQDYTCSGILRAAEWILQRKGRANDPTDY